jgi:hypothetical protein
MSKLTDAGAMNAIGLGAVTGSGLLMGGGALLGMLGSGDEDSGPSQFEIVQNLLNSALKDALAMNNEYSGKAISQQQQSLNDAINTLTGYNTQSQKLASSTMNNATKQYQALQSPYAQAGYDATDAYRQSLGMNNIVGGSANYANNSMQALELANQLNPLLSQMKGNYNPTAPEEYKALTAADVSEAKRKELQHQAAVKWAEVHMNAPRLGAGAKDLGIRQAEQYLNGDKNAMNYEYLYGPKDFINSPGLKKGGKTYTPEMQAQDRQNANISRAGTMDTLLNQNINDYLSSTNQAGQAQYQTQLGQYNQQKGLLDQSNSILQQASSNPQLMSLLASQLRGKI